MELQYNYVIFGADWDLYRFSYSDLFNKGYVKYFDSIESIFGIFSPLYKLHFSEKTNRYFRIPLKNVWNRLYFRSKFQNQEKPICFIFMGYWPRIVEQTDLIKYLKKQYKHSKFVLFSQDLVQTKQTIYTHEPLQQRHFRYYDMVLSFDHGDCEKYGFIYHPLVFSRYESTIKEPKNDIYFLGQAKNRLNDIIEAFEHLKTLGLSLDFNLIGVDESRQVYTDEIHYISGMSYLENLKHVENSKCLLEIVQGGAIGFTQRGCEAVCLNKQLLTNNSSIIQEAFYKQEYITIFNDIKEVGNDFIEKIRNNEVNYSFSDKMSPIELLEFVDQRI